VKFWMGFSPTAKSGKPRWWATPKNWASEGARRLASTTQTEPETFSAKVCAAVAHMRLHPLPWSIPANTTERGDTPICIRNSRCTSFRDSSFTSRSIFRPELFRWLFPFDLTTAGAVCSLGTGSTSSVVPACFSNSKFLLKVFPPFVAIRRKSPSLRFADPVAYSSRKE